MKGFAYAGALDELRKRHAIDWGARCPHIQVVYGCSIGAIVALALTVGYTTTELVDLVQAINLADIFDFDPVRFLSSIGDVSVGGLGMDDGKKLRRYLTDLIAKKVSVSTLGDLFQITGTDMRIHATNVSMGLPVTFSHTSHPNMPVVDAVYASAALPPFFSPLEIEGELYADGGIVRHDEEPCIRFVIHSPTAMEDMTQFPWPFASYLDRIVRMILHQDDGDVCIQSGSGAAMKFGDMTNMKLLLLESGRDAIRTSTYWSKPATSEATSVDDRTHSSCPPSDDHEGEGS